MFGGYDSGDDVKGTLWKLPVVRSKQFGKLGPGFGLGFGCGFGFGAGLLGGVGFGPGIPGLQLGFGVGAGCGVGVGFGYGVGRGVAYDDNRRYSNIGKLFQGRDLPTQDEMSALVDEVVRSTKKLIKATERKIDKWRR